MPTELEKIANAAAHKIANPSGKDNHWDPLVSTIANYVITVMESNSEDPAKDLASNLLCHILSFDDMNTYWRVIIENVHNYTALVQALEVHIYN